MFLIIILLLFLSGNVFGVSGTSYDTKSKRISNFYNARGLGVSTFGEIVTGERKNKVSVQFQYNIPPDLVTTSSVSGGSAVHDPDTRVMAKLATGSTVGGEASITSNRVLHYIPGHESYAYFTGIFNLGKEGATQWIGIFDDQDGFAIGMNGKVFSILYRRGGEEEIISWANFNIDTLDGKGASSIALDPDKINLFKISYGWLGTAPITFEISRRDGIWIPFHQIQRSNLFIVPSTNSPVLPIRAEVKNITNNTNIEFKTASWTAGNVGGEIPHRQNYKSIFGVKFNNKSEKIIIALKNKAIFEGRKNRTSVIIKRASIATLVASGWDCGKFVRVILKKASAGGVTGGTWINACSSSKNKTSSLEYNTTATNVVAKDIFSTSFIDRGFREYLFEREDTIFELFPGDELVVVGATNTPTTATVDIGLEWHETFC